jgi:hypothetical protein
MAKKIEIFENTLLKLLVRRGLDGDRTKIVLSEGELGYTTDTKRLYIGDGQTRGGVLVGGSKFLGSANDVTTFSTAFPSDMAYSPSTDKLYYFKGGNAADISDWSVIGGTYEAQNGTIVINSSNNDISVGTITSSNISSDIVTGSIVLNNTNRISLSSSIKVDRISGLNSDFITLPSSLRINSISYKWPTSVPSNSFLRSDASGTLSWVNSIDVSSNQFVYNANSIVPVGTIIPFPSTNAPSGWLLCNGQSVVASNYRELSAVIGNTYGGNHTSFNVPDLTTKTLYGVESNPAGSATFNVELANGSSPLYAKGILYIIKAKPDSVVDASMTVTAPLCASVNGVQRTGNSFNPLSGDIRIGLQTTALTGNTIIAGAFEADRFGRVIRQVVIDEPDPPAFDKGPGTRYSYNRGTSPISFFIHPATILTNTNNVSFLISAYPYITQYGGSRVTPNNLYSVPPTAKNLIVDSFIQRCHSYNSKSTRIIAAAPNLGRLNGTIDSIGTSEYGVNQIASWDSNDDFSSFNQAFIPLSANRFGHLVTAFRVNNSLTTDKFYVRVLGYTL